MVKKFGHTIFWLPKLGHTSGPPGPKVRAQVGLFDKKFGHRLGDLLKISVTHLVFSVSQPRRHLS